MFNLHAFLSTELIQFIAFFLFLYLCLNFLEILRCLNKRLIAKVCFICLTFGSFCISIYAIKNPVPAYMLLIGVGLIPLGMNRVRYG